MNVRIPPALQGRFRRLAEDTANDLGVPLDEAIRSVEQTVLKRGIESLEGDREGRS